MARRAHLVKKVTSQDVAKLAGVSRTTVSLVLNDVPGTHIPESTRQRVLEAARKLNYYPAAAARSLASGKTHVIGLVLCEGPDKVSADAFLPDVMRGIADEVSKHDYTLLFHTNVAPNDPNSYMKLVRGHHIDGLIVSAPRSDDPNLPELAKSGFPTVLHGRLPGTDIPFVDVDNIGGAEKAVNHLIALGHKRIGLITNAPVSFTSAKARLRGYEKALEKAGIPLDENLIRYGYFLPETGYRAMTELLELPKPPTGVFVASDVVAMGALAAVHEKGLRVPEEIAIVGFDDIFASAYTVPALTTVHLPAYDLGREAAKMLFDIMGGEDFENRHMFLETSLIVRKSCGGVKVQ